MSEDSVVGEAECRQGRPRARGPDGGGDRTWPKLYRPWWR